MKNKLIYFTLGIALITFSSCETCFKCHVYDTVNDAMIYEEPSVTCDESSEAHKSVLEKAYQCADCSFTTGGITTTDTYCDETEKVDDWVKERMDNPFIDYTCEKKNPAVNCYESE